MFIYVSDRARNKNDVFLQRQLPPEVGDRVAALKLPGIGQDKEYAGKEENFQIFQSFQSFQSFHDFKSSFLNQLLLYQIIII